MSLSAAKSSPLDSLEDDDPIDNVKRHAVFDLESNREERDIESPMESSYTESSVGFINGSPENEAPNDAHNPDNTSTPHDSGKTKPRIDNKRHSGVDLRVHRKLSNTYTSQDSPQNISYETLRQLYLRNPLDQVSKPFNEEYASVRLLNPFAKKRILVTGGAGFVGSHLVDRLLLLGHDVICLDNYFTGSKANVSHWLGHPNFELIRHDVVDSIMLEVDQIYHLACPASPVHYQYNPVKTLKTGFFGTYNMLGLAKRVKARFLLASTSEIYGDPAQHPQSETYWGNVNCNGPRACYDEGKRVAETLAYSYHRQDGVEVRVARIFNTFGPRMNWNDGRVVSNFILQALKNEDLTIYGDGLSTRSFQFIADLVDGLIALMNSDYSDPVNLGNPEEFTIADFAHEVIDLVRQETGQCSSKVIHLPELQDDPHRRRPDPTVAEKVLGWSPNWSVADGVRETVRYFKHQIDAGAS